MSHNGIMGFLLSFWSLKMDFDSGGKMTVNLSFVCFFAFSNLSILAVNVSNICFFMVEPFFAVLCSHLSFPTSSFLMSSSSPLFSSSLSFFYLFHSSASHTLSHYSPCVFLFLLVSPDTALTPPPPPAVLVCAHRWEFLCLPTCTRAFAMCIYVCVCVCVLWRRSWGAVNLLSGLIHLKQARDSAWLHTSESGHKGSQNLHRRRAAHPVSPSGVQLLLLLSYSVTSKSTNGFF